MTTEQKVYITVATTVKAPVEKVWKIWNDPVHIVQWNTATDTWHTPRSTNDLRIGGKLYVRMEAKDGSFGFDLNCIYTDIQPLKKIEYSMEDNRTVSIVFTTNGATTTITETFEAEKENTVELQRDGWQAIMNNFKKHIESQP